jgi:hypothetical protein
MYPIASVLYGVKLLNVPNAVGCGARTLTAVAVVLMLVTVAWSASAGDSHVLTENEHFMSYRYQPAPGDMDYDSIDARPVWNSGSQNISTAVLCEDLDDDGVLELVFGTDSGRLFAVELGTWYEDIKEEVVEGGEVHALAIGNLDDDEDREIAVASSEGLHCFDTSNGKVAWERDYQTFDGDLQLVPARVEKDELARSDVLFLRTKGEAITGTEHFVIRVDGEGSEVYKTRLQEKEDRPALHASWVVADLDRDNDLDAFVCDRGRAGIGASGPGKNIWLVEVGNGTLADRWVIRHATLASRPALVVSRGWKYVAVGMEQGLGTADRNDLVMFDGTDRSFQYLDVHQNDEVVAWQYLTYVPDATSGTLVLASSNWKVHAHHLVDRNVSWTRDFSGSGLANIPVACDIDDDGRNELLFPGGGITFVDALTGEEEGRYQPERGTPILIAMTVGDVDDDDVSEVVFGYHESQTTGVYELTVLGDLDIPEPEPPPSRMWGYLFVVLLVAANVALFADLYFRHWKRREEG